MEKTTASERRAAKRQARIEKGERIQGLAKSDEPTLNPINRPRMAVEADAHRQGDSQHA